MSMEKLKKGDKLQLQCYKHSGSPHRSWEEAIVLDVKSNYLVVGTNHTLIIKAQGSSWRTKEPTIVYLFKNKWYNVIAQLKKDGITYKCNIATPFIVEDDTVKCIDYELDLRIFSNGSFKVLDRNEYKLNKKKMNYPNELDRIIQYSLSELIRDYRNGAFMFNENVNLRYAEEYKKIKEKNR